MPRQRDSLRREDSRRRDSPTSRRDILRGIAGGLAGAGLAPFARIGRAAEGVTVIPVAGGLDLLEGAGGNILARATDEGLVLVDSGAAAAGEAVLATLEELGGGPVRAIFNTHWHPDQVGSNEAFGMAGATIYAHDKTRQRLRSGYYLQDEDRYAPALPPAALPTETTFDEARAEIGGLAVEYGYLIEAHTDGDIFVAFPELDVVAVGDAISPERDPVFDWFGGGWLGGRLDSLDLLLARSGESTRFVPSYGPVVGRAEVQAEYEMYRELFDRMVEHVRLGETPRDMLELGLHEGLGREFDDPYRLLYALHKGFWAHHNKLTHDIV